MTDPPRPEAIPIPISSLLPPSTSASTSTSKPTHSLPSPSTAILGPLPPTSALHLALNYLYLSDLPEYESVSAATGKKQKLEEETVLIVTGPKTAFAQEMEEEDEDWFRERGGDYGVLNRLSRVDMRYCLTPQHILLLLTLLTTGRQTGSPHHIRQTPGVVILLDIARLLMEQVEVDEENMPPEGVDMVIEKREVQKGEWRFRNSVKLSHYLDVIAAARAAVDHLSSLDTSKSKTQLIILEPNISALSTLPILRGPIGDADMKIATPTREKRISIRDGLAWMLGDNAIGFVEERWKLLFYAAMRKKAYAGDLVQDPNNPSSATHTLSFPCYPNEAFHMIRQRCPRSEWSAANALESPVEGMDEQVEKGGWRWSWTAVSP